MPFISIDEYSGLFCEGGTNGGAPVRPTPTTAPAKIASITDNLMPGEPVLLPSVQLMFREDSYDPVTRVRRGRFYSAFGSRPSRWWVRGGGLSEEMSLCVFEPAHLPQLLRPEVQQLIILGAGEHFSIWSVVGSEIGLSREVNFLMRARQTYGALPNLIAEAIPKFGRVAVQKAFGTLNDELFLAGPESVIDRARDLAAVALSTLLQDMNLVKPGHDLGQLISIMLKMPDASRKRLAESASEIIRILHPRAKSSEQEKRVFRPISEQDGELAVLAVGTLMCELQWARWR